MKRFTLSFVLVLVLLALPLMAFAPMPLHTTAAAAPDVLSIILAVGAGFAALIGVAALVSALVQLGKIIGLIKDGKSDQWTAILNLLAFIALVGLRIYRAEWTLEYLDTYAGLIAQALVYILGFVIQITSSKPIYDRMKAARVPLLGWSFSRSAVG